MKSLKLTVVLLWCLSVFAQAQQIPLLDEPSLPRFQSTLVIPQAMTPARQEVSFRGSFPAEIQDSFQLALETMLADLDSKGLSAAVIASNGDEWLGAAGVSHEGVPMTTDMYLGMGSVSKSLTAACILKLEEEGLLSTDDTLSQYLGSYPNVDSSVTLLQLLNHTTGIYDYVKNPVMLDSMKKDFSRVWTPDEVLNDFVKTPYFEKGQGWAYSNSNYLLLGLVIEKVTGQAYHEVIRQKILEPAGLGALFLNPYETTTGTIAHVWLPFNGSKLDLDAFGLTPISVYSAAWAAGGYFARTEVMAKWMQALLSGQILSEASLTKMKTTVPAGDIEYGLGLMKISNDTLEAYGHQGYIIYSSLCFYDPTTELTIAVQSNDGTSTDLSAFLGKAYLLYRDLVETKSVATVAGKSYPNPATETLTIELPESLGAQYELGAADMLGHRLTPKIMSRESNRLELDVRDWAGGIYFIRLWDGARNVVYRVSVTGSMR